MHELDSFVQATFNGCPIEPTCLGNPLTISAILIEVSSVCTHNIIRYNTIQYDAVSDWTGLD